jgi:LmbE family N-acetylglucosaminyl deacetylase
MESPATSQEKIRYRAIFVSPHLDDAILSCGGTIHQLAQAGNRVLIVTAMAGDPPAGAISPFAQSLRKRWRLAAEDTVARRSEDIKACRSLSASWLHWDIPDCIYRRSIRNDKPLYDSEESLFGEINQLEIDLVDYLADLMRSLPAAESIFMPLGAGNHVDHQLTRMASERWLEPSSFAYYEEYPYADTNRQLDQAIGNPKLWRAEIFGLEPDDIQARIRAIACYQSQISTFFDGLEDLAQKVSLHISSIGGERYWKVVG